MSDTRPAIPRGLRRAVEVEAGHRCAVTTCRATSGLEIHHIDDWAKVKEHSFENLLLICAVCHARATKGEIDRRSMLAYKANLQVLNGRYGDLERRVLDYFVRNPEAESIVVDKSHAILLGYLLEDGLIVQEGLGTGAIWLRTGSEGEAPGDDDITLGPMEWRLTDRGAEVVHTLRAAAVLE